jgi:hypothetical protein
MKGCLTVFIILVIAAGIGYFWWQGNAQRMIAAEVKRQGRHFFTNTEALVVKNDPIQLIDLRRAKVPKLVITGEDLRLRAGIDVKSAKLVLTNVVISGPPFNISSVGGGSYTVTVEDRAVTDYLTKRGTSLRVGMASLNGVTVHFGDGRANNRLVAEVEVPILGKREVTAVGYPVPSSKIGQIDFRVTDVNVVGWKIGAKPVTDALNLLNPVVDVSDWPLVSDFTSVTTRKGSVAIKAEIMGWRGGMLPGI